MLVAIQHQLEVPGDVDAAALRDLASKLYADAGATVVSSHAARVTRAYTVHGVNMATSEPFTQVVHATSVDDAHAQATTRTRVVATAIEAIG